MLSEETVLYELSEEGYRLTRPRRAVIQVLLQDDGHSSPAQVHQQAQALCPSVSLVTVYRTLDLLTRLGFVRRIHADDGCHGYTFASHGHRHHLICRRCGATTEFEGCDLGSFLERVGRETGYAIEDHLLELVGLCATCQEGPW